MSISRLATIAVAFFMPISAYAGSDSYDASSMWGTSPSGAGGEGALNSAAAHTQNGIVAGQVNAAEDGLLYANGSGESYNIYSIGSQSVISNNILGHDNDVNIDADQSSQNNGAISNDGQINTGKNAKNSQ